MELLRIQKTSEVLISVNNLQLSYGETPILKNINFNVHKGEVLGVIGESGSGKTSLLKIIGGLLQASSGSVYYKDKQVLGPKEQLVAGHEKIKIVNQDFDLMPFISVEENVIKGNLSYDENKRKKLIHHYTQKLQISAQKEHLAKNTSGGQKQRVAIANALASKPSVLLLDEPFSHLDFPLKQEVIRLLQKKWQPQAMIVVTHEPADMLRLADRAIVLHKGKIVQKDSMDEVYNKPKSMAVAKLLGHINKLSVKEAQALGCNTKKNILVRPEHFVWQKKGVEVRLLETKFVGLGYESEVYVEAFKRSLKIFHIKPYTEINGLKLALKN